LRTFLVQVSCQSILIFERVSQVLNTSD